MNSVQLVSIDVGFLSSFQDPWQQLLYLFILLFNKMALERVNAWPWTQGMQNQVCRVLTWPRQAARRFSRATIKSYIWILKITGSSPQQWVNRFSLPFKGHRRVLVTHKVRMNHLWDVSIKMLMASWVEIMDSVHHSGGNSSVAWPQLECCEPF